LSSANLIKIWKNNGGSAFEYEQPEGFCRAMCQYWISLRMQGQRGDAIMFRFLGQNMRQIVHDRQEAIGSTSRRIPGTIKHDEGTKEDGRGALRGRTEALAKITTTRGLYIYGNTGFASSGHAIAFDTTQPDLYFMDPNFGQVWFENCVVAKGAFFDSWFRSYWEDEMWSTSKGATSYKKNFISETKS